MDPSRRVFEPCERCGDDTGTGTALYADRTVVDGRLLCAERPRAERGGIKPLYPEPDVPIEMPDTNLPSTH